MTTGDDTHDGSWYVKRGDQVKGPFGRDLITRNIGLGRIRDSDCVSRDGRLWEQVSVVDLAQVGNLRGVPAYDERHAERRLPSDDDPGKAGKRSGDDRRVAESPEVQARRARSARVWAALRPHHPRTIRAMLAVGLMLVVLLAVAIVMAQPSRRVAIDCSAAPGRNISWDFCNKAGLRFDDARFDSLSARNAGFAGASLGNAHLRRADLAYADFGGADLSLADLRAARLVGASLRRAVLHQAVLAGADLRFADLTGASVAGADFASARLDHAIWIDGRLCARESIGRCRLP